MSIDISKGARIVVQDWLRVHPSEIVSIITDELHQEESLVLRKEIELARGLPILVTIPSDQPQRGEQYDSLCASFIKNADASIGATHNSIMTMRSISEATAAGLRFLSLPLSTNNGLSLLQSDMMLMNPDEAQAMGIRLVRFFEMIDHVHLRTDDGTDLQFSINGRKRNIFNGRCDKSGISTSVSFEFSVSIVESSTEGSLVLDGSMGYIGLVEEPVHLRFEKGWLVEIEDNASGRRLRHYIDSFKDARMAVPAEFGIGLNKYAKCQGNSYIEDESSFGTFHIGFGRNISLGGNHYANGHFDVICHASTLKVNDIPLAVMRDNPNT